MTPPLLAGWREPGSRAILLLYVGIALALTYVHYLFIDVPLADRRYVWHGEIVTATAESPQRYRVLLPAVAEVGRVLGEMAGLGSRKGVLGAYVVIRALALSAGFILFHAYLRRWFARTEALAGTLFVAAMMPLTFIHYGFQPTSHPEFVSFILGMDCILRRRPGWLWIVLAVSTLNRETAVFLVVPFVAASVGLTPFRWWAGWSALYAVTWTAVYGGLRLALGWAKHVDEDRPDAFTYRFVDNVTTWDTYFTVAVFFGVFWVLAWRDWYRKPVVLRRTAAFVPVFFAFYLWLGHIHEVRFFLELCPIVVPLALMTLFGEPGARPAMESPPPDRRAASG